ncbi:hypothetical protein Cgig2_003215 [Carnegiea gigantea]|uniref:Uncharacterized protein n=1 Tax=Carnegiea gigantea TaxID=171969 RepID=A0A9Q1K522_9CARY|nr:hypothetical protein Cgig2_003215 [Carnegiea gigantea]
MKHLVTSACTPGRGALSGFSACQTTPREGEESPAAEAAATETLVAVDSKGAVSTAVTAEGRLPLLLNPMWRSAALYLFGQQAQAAQLRVLRCQAPRICFSTMVHAEARNPVTYNDIGKEGRTEYSFPVGQKISRREKINFLIKAVRSTGSDTGQWTRHDTDTDMDTAARDFCET